MKHVLLPALLMLFHLAAGQTWQWTKAEPNTEGDANVYRVLTDSLGNVYQLGAYKTSLYLSNQLRETGAGGFVAKYNASGTLIWYRTFKALNTGGEINVGDMAMAGNRLIITGKFNVTYYDRYPSCPDIPVEHYTYSIGTNNFSTTPGEMGLFFTAMDFNGSITWLNRANAFRNTCITGTRSVNLEPGIATDQGGNIYLTIPCNTGDALGFNLGGYIPTAYRPGIYGNDLLVVAKYNTTGNLIWSNFAQDVYTSDKTSGSLVPTSVALDKSGNLFINARLNDSTRLGNLMFRTKSNNAYALATGYSNYATSVLLKVSPSGSWQFAKEIASVTWNANQPRLQNLAFDNADNLYMGVSMVPNCSCGPAILLGDTVKPGMNNTYLVKLDNNANLKWKKSFGTNQTDGQVKAIVFNSNALFLAGSIRDDLQPYHRFPDITVPNPSYNTSTVGALRYMVAKADTSGAFQWVTLVTGISNLEAQTLAVQNGAIYTGGNYRIRVTGLGRLNGTFNSPFGNTVNLFTARINDKYYKISSVTPATMCPGGQVKVSIQSVNLPLSATNTFTAQLSAAGGIFPATPLNIGFVQASGSSTITATLPPNLPYGSTYKVRVVSSDTLKTGFPYFVYAADGVNVTIGCAPPSAGFLVNNITIRSARINWSPIGCATGYRVQYRRRGTSTWTTRDVPTNTGSFTADTLLAATSYDYRIASRCSNNGTPVFSSYSGTRSFTTLATTPVILQTNRIPMLEEELVISPNPVSNILNLRCTAFGPKPLVQVIDTKGRVVLQQRLATGESITQANLNVAILPAGMYFIRVLAEHRQMEARFLKL